MSAEQPLCRAYHWTKAENLPAIATSKEVTFANSGNQYVKTIPAGLWPQFKLAYLDSEKRELIIKGPYTFCFMDSPYPPEWQRHPVLFGALLLWKIAPNFALVSFDVFLSDNPGIAEIGYGIKHFNGEHFAESFMQEDYKSYVYSIKSLQAYRAGEFVLPELVIPTHIAYDRLTFEPIPDFVNQFR